MNSKKVPGAKISSIIALFLLGSSLVTSSGSEAHQDTWITMIFAMGGAFLLAWLYSAILKLHPGKGMFDIFLEVFGSIGGKIFCGIYVVYAILLGARVFYLFNEFIQIVNLDKTPTIAIMLFSVPLIAWQVRSGLKNVGSCAKFLVPIALSIVAVTIFLGIRFMNPDNIKPIFRSGADGLTRGTIANLALPMGEIVLCMSFFGEVDSKEKPFKIFANGILLGGSVLVTITLRNLLILGPDTNETFLFASYDAVGVISVGDFITRISVVIGINLVLAAIIKLSTLLYTATTGVSKILGLKSFLQPAVPCCLLMGTLSCALYTNLLSAMDFMKYDPFVSLPFQLFLPLIVLIVGKIKASARSAGEKRQPHKEAPPASGTAEENCKESG